jgi:hypothetical protein
LQAFMLSRARSHDKIYFVTLKIQRAYDVRRRASVSKPQDAKSHNKGRTASGHFLCYFLVEMNCPHRSERRRGSSLRRPAMTASLYQVSSRIALLGIALIWMVAETSPTLAHDSWINRGG